MSYRHMGAALAVVMLAGAAQEAIAAQAQADATVGTARFCGPVISLPTNCVGVRNSDGKVYELNSIGPRPVVGTTIVGIGITDEKITLCQSGVHVVSALWRVTPACIITDPVHH